MSGMKVVYSWLVVSVAVFSVYGRACEGTESNTVRAKRNAGRHSASLVGLWRGYETCCASPMGLHKAAYTTFEFCWYCCF